METLSALITVTACTSVGFSLMVIAWRLVGNHSEDETLTTGTSRTSAEAVNTTFPQNG